MKNLSRPILAAVLLCFSLTVGSQNITVHSRNVSIKEAITQITKKSGYNFVFSTQDVNTNKKVSLALNHADIDEAVKQLLNGQSHLTYTIEGKTVIIRNVQNVNGDERQNKLKTVNKINNSHEISGQILDEQGEPVMGATIMESGTANGTVSDMNGYFTLNVSSNNLVEISYIGFTTQKVKATKNMQITMHPDLQSLNEVVVIGYGTQRKADLTGAVANIDAKQLNTQSNTNIGQALQGKIPGVEIVSQGGAPGASPRIMIRGIGTLNNATPLYIVDGMYLNGIDHLNPNDIQSIDILKDASSAAIYGSRAANGVIIITTKSGSNTEGKPIIDLSMNVGAQTAAKKLDMLNANQWAQVTTTARAAANKSPLDMALNLESKEDNNWQDLLMQTALFQNYDVSIKGGSKYHTYYTGLGYINQDGIIKGTNYQRYSGTLKSEYHRDWFTFGQNVVLSYQKNKPTYPFARGGILGIIMETIPTMSQYDASNPIGRYGKNYGDVTDIPNPMGILDENITRRNNYIYNANINLYAEVKLPYGLKYRLNLMPNYSMTRSMAYENVYDFGLRRNSISNMSDTKSTSTSILMEHLLSYNQTFGKHKINAFVGWSYQKQNYRYVSAFGKGLPDGIYEVGAATQDRGNDTYAESSALKSIMGRLFYSYDNRYLATLTYRRDGSSKFMKKNRYGSFPSISLAWNIAEEAFMKRTRSWLDQLKLRGGYGVLGNQEIGNYQYTSTITSNINYPNGNGGVYIGAFPKIFANPDIRWEETTMTNIGLDMLFLNSKLSFIGEWYYKKTKDILITVPIPLSAGGANDPIRNAGVISNKGVELSLIWNDQVGKDFRYSIGLNGSFMTNKVLEMGENRQVLNGGTNYKNVSTTKTLVDYPIGGFWLIKTDGLFQSVQEVQAHQKDGKLIQPSAQPGDIRFVDYNNDGIINNEDRQYCGSPFPKFSGSLNFTAAYKKWDILLNFQSVLGNKIYNGTRLDLESVDKGINFLASTLNSWTENNRNTDMPRLNWNDPNNNNNPQTDRFLENGAFFKLRNVQLGYTMTNLFNDFIKQLRIYVNAENLFTITDYKGFTPDVNGSGSATSRGFDNFTYPLNRTILLGINVSF